MSSRCCSRFRRARSNAVNAGRAGACFAAATVGDKPCGWGSGSSITGDEVAAVALHGGGGNDGVVDFTAAGRGTRGVVVAPGGW